MIRFEIIWTQEIAAEDKVEKEQMSRKEKIMRNRKRFMVLCMAVCLGTGLLAGCGTGEKNTHTGSAKGTTEKKTFVFGDTTFNPENEEPDVNPHNAYAGWACIRYGVGETLFKYSDSMEIQPWLAKDYENIDELTWQITLQDGVKFSSGREMTGEAVKECLEHLVEVDERAKGDLMIDTITTEGQTVTIKTTEPKPTLLNYLSDPYGCIIDIEAGVTEDGIVAGTVTVYCRSFSFRRTVKVGEKRGILGWGAWF